MDNDALARLARRGTRRDGIACRQNIYIAIAVKWKARSRFFIGMAPKKLLEKFDYLNVEITHQRVVSFFSCIEYFVLLHSELDLVAVSFEVGDDRCYLMLVDF